jgi:hypothetical protein
MGPSTSAQFFDVDSPGGMSTSPAVLRVLNLGLTVNLVGPSAMDVADIHHGRPNVDDFRQPPCHRARKVTIEDVPDVDTKG